MAHYQAIWESKNKFRKQLLYIETANTEKNTVVKNSEIASWAVAVPKLVYESLKILIFKMLGRARGNQKHPNIFLYHKTSHLKNSWDDQDAPVINLL